ncbi:MAG: Gamma-glutamyl-GABA hydrolase, partial [uncultured Nocardioidaceae bacterium]
CVLSSRSSGAAPPPCRSCGSARPSPRRRSARRCGLPVANRS